MPGVIHFDTEKDVSKLLSAFHDRGYTELDTAANYAGSEYRLGLVAAPSKFTIHTKIKSGLPGDLTADKIALSVEKSLQDFKTTSVQTFLLHAPDRETDPEETVKAMHEVVKQGKCKEWGLSNYKSEEVKEILRICNGKGYIKPTVYEGHYNALVRGGEDELFPLLREHKMAFWAYRYDTYHIPSRFGVCAESMLTFTGVVRRLVASSKLKRKLILLNVGLAT
jgi:aflatoxin B1 aldehyde reductase